MKKVLALVLAVIMVCTMAMAVGVTGVTTATENTLTAENARYRVVVPGEAIVFERSELKLDDSHAVLNKDGTFAPEKNKVDVTFEKGADLVASKGWVKVKEASGGVAWKYVIVTKENDAAILDATPDIIISKVSVTKYGIDGSADYYFAKKEADGTMKYTYGTIADMTTLGISDSYAGWRTLDTTDTGMFFLVFNYGRHYDKDSTVLKASATATYTSAAIAADTIGNTLYPIAKGNKVTEKVALFVVTDKADSNSYSKLQVGSKVYFVKVADYEINEKVQNDLYAKDATLTTVIEKDTVVPHGVNVEIAVNNAKEGYSMYVINADGSLKNLNAKIDDNGVLRATAKVTGPVVLSDKALTSMSTTGTGTTTNPGTGANDVVGVAAALAVVALVSGAAISLKK